mgnify:CR=1 FL=1
MGKVLMLKVKTNQWFQIGRGVAAGTAVAINPNRVCEIAAGFSDGSVVCFDTRAIVSKTTTTSASTPGGTSNRLCTLSEHKLPVHSVSFHARLELLATADRTKAVLWNTETWTKVQCLQQPGHIVRKLQVSLDPHIHLTICWYFSC